MIINKAWIVAVDMGYGHQRAAYPLKQYAYGGEIVNANRYPGIPQKDKKIWQQGQEVYEFMSRFKKVPVIGEAAWDLYDQFQEIDPFYPKRDLSRPSLQLKSTYSLIRKKRWGEHFIKRLAKNPLPLVSTFFIPAYQAEEFNYPGDIYIVACDADVSRAWAPLKPSRSRIKYLAPTERAVERLKLYGVRTDQITLTGFPLPRENRGVRNSVVKADLAERLVNLDPKRVYCRKYHRTIREHVGILPKRANHPLTIMFTVGGAGAQRDLGLTIAESFYHELSDDHTRLVLVAGIHNDVSRYFREGIARLGLRKAFSKGSLEIIFAAQREEYFQKFNVALRTTDILWTKPSELVFYAGLGIPIICSDPIGSQEFFNRRWVREVGAGTKQLNPRYAAEWIKDLLNEGWFAEAAMQGYLDIEQEGVENIEKAVLG
ncbi:MAG: hypothetical protein WC659_00265 [Patescibacteria group bacterium]